MKTLTVIVPTYLENKKNYNKIYNSISFHKNFDIKLINDNAFLKIEGFENNEENLGKFWTCFNYVKSECKTKYFLTIDPDDILNNDIDWNELSILTEKLSEIDADFIVNSFYFKNFKTNKIKFKKTPSHIFNPNSIYNTKNVKNNDLKKIYLNYFEDLSLFLLSIGDGKIAKVNNPFYTYTYGSGLSSKSKDNFKLDILNAYNIMMNNKFKINSLLKFKIYITRILRLKKLKRHL